MARRSEPLRIAIDTGGTFTDCVWIDPSTRRLQMLKVFSTPADPSRAIVEAQGGGYGIGLAYARDMIHPA